MMREKTDALATTPRPLGKPGGPGLFRDPSLNLPPYVQNVAHSLMEKRGMSKSRAIATALATVKRWAAGGDNVRPEVRAAATRALAQWEAARAKARATPNKSDVSLSQPMTLLRTVLEGSEAVELAQAAEEPASPSSQPGKASRAASERQRPKAEQGKKDKKDKKGSKEYQKGRHKLPPGAVGWKHGWVPVDENGNPVGPSQKDKSASEIADMAKVSSEASKDAIRQAYANKAKKDGEKAAREAKSAAKKAETAKKAAARKAEAAKKAATRKAEAAKKRAAAEAKRRAAAKERAAKKAATEAKRKATQKAREKAAKQKEKQRLVSQATKQALADKKAGRPLTPSQTRLLEAYEEQQAETLDKLRHDVTLSQPMALLRGVLDGSQAIDLAAPGSRGYIYTHGWKLKAGVNLPNNGKLPKGKLPKGKPGGKAIPKKVAASPQKSPAPATAAPKVSGTPSHPEPYKYTAAKQSATKANQAIQEANKANTAVAHGKAAQALLDAYKANQAVGLKNSAAASFEAAQVHSKKAQALGGIPKTPGGVSDAPYTVHEEIQIEKAAHQLFGMPDDQFKAMAQKHGNASKATTRQEQMRAEAVRRAEQLRALTLSNEFGGGGSPATVPTVSSQDGARATVNSLLTKFPRHKVKAATKQAQKKRRGSRRKGEK